jgi:hypothetical protein
MFNTWNHTNFDGVAATFGGGGFGQVVSARTPRIIQFALKVSF